VETIETRHDAMARTSREGEEDITPPRREQPPEPAA